MNKLFCLLAIGLLMASSIGCANGPIRQWFKGSACNTCQPALQPSCGTQALGNCTDGCNPSNLIPQPFIQPSVGQNSAAADQYYSANDPTTQSYNTQPVQGNSPYGQISGQINGNQILGSGAAGNLNPPNGPTPGPNGF